MNSPAEEGTRAPRRSRSLTVTETAKIIRTVLKREFPGTKFSVRSDKYAGGASIDIGWTDGPLDREVSAVAKKFEAAGFDGMIDLKYHKEHYLRPDGSVLLAHTNGTEGSRGLVPAQNNRNLEPVLPDDAELVSLGADFVFTRREISNGPERRAEAAKWVYDHCHIENRTGEPRHDRFGGHFVSDMAAAMAANLKEGESLETAYRRVYLPHHDEA